MSKFINIDGQSVATDTLTPRAQAMVETLRMADRELSHKRELLKLLNYTKLHLIRDLKSELINSRAGFDLRDLFND